MNVRFVRAAFLGVVIAFALAAGIEAIGHVLYPPPAGLDFSNREQVRNFVASRSANQLLFVLGGWAIATFTGGLVAAWFAREHPYRFAGLVGAAVLAASIANMVMIPHPLWVWAAALVAVPLAALLAGLAAPKPAKNVTDD